MIRDIRRDNLTRSATLIAGVATLLLLATGCGSRFAGEWVEVGSYDEEDIFREAEGQRRLALRFDPPATVRYGTLVYRTGVVDHQTVQTDMYLTMQGRQVAQFGSIIAHVDRGRMIATIGGDVVTVFERVRGKRVFPPAVHLPSLAKRDEGAMPIKDQQVTEVLAAAP